MVNLRLGVLVLSATVVAVACILAASAAYAQDGPIIKEGGARFVGGEVVTLLQDGRVAVEKVPGADTIGELERAAGELVDLPGVEAAGPNYVYAPQYTPNDQLYPDQWNLRSIRAPLAHAHSRGGVTVGFVDSGWQHSHRDLRTKIAPLDPEFDFVSGTSTPRTTPGTGPRPRAWPRRRRTTARGLHR
jgi:hypothetical protein